MTTLERWESRYTGRVTITDNCAVTVKVTGYDGKVYEKMSYINCFEHGTEFFLPNGTQDQSGSGQTPSNTPTGTTTGGNNGTATVTSSASASTDPDGQPDTTPRSPTALTPDGQGTVMDNVTEENGKEFFTITTPSENIFYLIIDKQRDSDNVYFLNTVTENDLMALAEKDSGNSGISAIPDPDPVCICKEKCEVGAVNTACSVCVLSIKDCQGTAPTPVESPEPPKESNNAGTMVIVLLAALAAGGVGWYFKIYKPKHDMSDAEDFDELTGGGDEPMVNEDEEPEAQTRQEPEAYPEPEEPDYLDGYEDDM